MNRPYIICHMVTSIDSKVTGDFLYTKNCEKATEVYYEINRNYKADGFICGRVTMEGSFTGKWYPDLATFEEIEAKDDYIPDNLSGFYAVAFDPKGKLGWKSNKITDEDPGYDNAQVIEVLTKGVNGKFLAYLKENEIPYIFAGDKEIDVNTALTKLKAMGIKTLLLEGGSVINGYFQRAGAIDELSLVVAPVVAEKEDKPLFTDSTFNDFELVDTKVYHNEAIWLNYRRNENA